MAAHIHKKYIFKHCIQVSLTHKQSLHIAVGGKRRASGAEKNAGLTKPIRLLRADSGGKKQLPGALDHIKSR